VSIACPGHSGSTLLDMALGTLPKISSCGELIYIPWKIYKQNHPEKYETTYCSCGETMSHCPYWAPVLTLTGKKTGIDIFVNPKKFNIAIYQPFYYGKSLWSRILRNTITEGSRYIPVKFLIDFLYPFYMKRIKNNWILFDAINKIHDKQVIIDSTKDIYRYLFLKKYRPNSTKLIILVRDVYGVASSIHNNLELTEKIIFSRAKGWLKYYNNRVFNVIKYLDKKEYFIVKYEDLANNINLIRRKLALFLDIKEKINDISSIYPEKMHIVAGNPIRMNYGKIHIKYDERWKDRLSGKQIKDLSIIQNRLNPIFHERYATK
jgi:hypothetical protein